MSKKNEIDIIPEKGSIEELEKFARMEAVEGKPESIKLLADIQYSKDFNTARRDIFYGSEVDDKMLHRLESYIESGCTIKLKQGEDLYLEAMTLMLHLNRKYGRAKTIQMYCNKPFNLKYADARKMFEQSINLFYIDSNIEKKALRNLKAQQLEAAADMVLKTAKTPKDFETYAKLIMSSAKMLQLDIPDLPEVPKGTYDRPYKYFSLDPKKIGVDRIDRNLLGKQIDSITGATEAEKQLAKYDAGLGEIPFEEIINEHEKEN